MPYFDHRKVILLYMNDMPRWSCSVQPGGSTLSTNPTRTTQAPENVSAPRIGLTTKTSTAEQPSIRHTHALSLSSCHTFEINDIALE